MRHGDKSRTGAPWTRRTGGVALAALALGLLGCGPPESTRFRAEDFDAAIPKMVDSLAGSSFLRGRAADSQPVIIVVNKVTNLTTDVIPDTEQWMVMARIRGALPIQDLSKTRKITFQITPERWEQLRRAGFDGELGQSQTPTHVMSATFRSARRAVRDRHGNVCAVTDFYYCEFRITDLKTREIAWTDKFEFGRSARGNVID